MSQYDFDQINSIEKQYSQEFIQSNLVIVLSENSELCTIGFVPPAKTELFQSLRQFHKKQIEFVEVDRSLITRFILNRSNIHGKDQHRDVNKKHKLEAVSDESTVTNLANTVLMEGIHRNASDIHIEFKDGQTEVRYRVDGIMQTGGQLNSVKYSALSARLKIMSDLDIIDNRIPQDGRLMASFENVITEFRISIVPLHNGESIVLRIFNTQKEAPTIETLGFGENHLSIIKSILLRREGLILVTGPTGSGKTTTLATLLSMIANTELKCISIEDPVEINLKAVNQIQVNESLGVDFEAVLRRILRQDPDVLMIGEIRDAATAEIAVKSAMTGHLILSSLHTSDSISTISRLTNLGLPPYAVAEVVKLVISQRLVRKICSVCKNISGSGCEVCNHSGWKGQQLIAEILEVDDELREGICSQLPMNQLHEMLKRKRFTYLADDALAKVRAGITTRGEIERVIELK